MKKLICLYSLFLLLLSGCEEHEFKVLEDSSWQITEYTIDGVDSMTTIKAFHLEGEFSFGERGGSASTPDLVVTTIAHDTTYMHFGEWWYSSRTDMLEISLFKGLGNVGIGILPKIPKDGRYYVNKPSFKPFLSYWTIKKLTKKVMQLGLALDNRKYYLRFKPYKL